MRRLLGAFIDTAIDSLVRRFRYRVRLLDAADALRDRQAAVACVCEIAGAKQLAAGFNARGLSVSEAAHLLAWLIAYDPERREQIFGSAEFVADTSTAIWTADDRRLIAEIDEAFGVSEW